ncbi:MAG: hypothetical protein IR159_04320 [Brevundimonas sp.]|nr:hypothetical protein [Brevundimonas sp.]
MRQTLTLVSIAALAASVAACSNPQSAPEPENEATAAAMPQTPDRSDTAADERAAGVETPGATPADAPPAEPAPAY